MSYRPGGYSPHFPVQPDTFGNDPGIGPDTEQERARQLPIFGPAFVPFVDQRITDLERAVAKAMATWTYEPVTVLFTASMQSDSNGVIDPQVAENAILYTPPAGFTFALHRFVLSADGFTFGVPFVAAGSYWELQVNGAMVDGASTVSGVGSLPRVMEWGNRNAPRVRDGERLSLYVSGTGTLASKLITARCQGTLDRTAEG